MITELFLTCALAMPVATIQHPKVKRLYDIGVFQFIIQHYHKYNETKIPNAGRIYLLGGEYDALASMRRAGIKAFRVTIEPSTPFDIVAVADKIPLAKESALVVVYFWELRTNPWQSMKLWNEATATLPPGGVIAFYPKFARYFPGIAKQRGWEKMPFNWYEMEIWKKKEWKLGGNVRGPKGQLRQFGRSA